MGELAEYIPDQERKINKLLMYPPSFVQLWAPFSPPMSCFQKLSLGDGGRIITGGTDGGTEKVQEEV